MHLSLIKVGRLRIKRARRLVIPHGGKKFKDQLTGVCYSMDVDPSYDKSIGSLRTFLLL